MAQELDIPTSTDYDEQNFFVRPSRGETLRIALLGLAIGLLMPLLSFAIEQFFIKPVFCQSGDGASICAAAGSTAYYAASSILTVVAIIVLANWQVFRPLLIAIAATAALWGFNRYVQDIVGSSGVEYYAFSAALYTFAYLLFYWAMRARSFMVSVIVTVLLVIAVRWVLIL